MGDYPSRQAWTSLELSDQIFSLALQDPALQDEVYCQILKQLTHNTKRSAGMGWGEGPLAPSALTPGPRGCACSSERETGAHGGSQPTRQWEGLEPGPSC